MAGRPRSSRKWLVEDCEVIRATDQNLEEYVYGRLRILWRPMSSRRWLECPACGRRCFKLYRPYLPKAFACRDCHNLTYRSAQRHDARLAPFLKMSEEECQAIIESGGDRERRLALRAHAYRAEVQRESSG
jgi:hypothetical protein